MDIYVYINGVRKSLVQLSQESGVAYDTIYARWKNGVPADQLVTFSDGFLTRDEVVDSLGYTPGRVNPNLLDNWYFISPVNQRGKTAYTAAGYTIDRWKLVNAGGTLTVNANSILLTRSASSTALLRQIIDTPAQYYGKTVTLSALTAAGVLVTKTGTIPAIPPSSANVFARADFDANSYFAGLLNTDGSLYLQFKPANESPIEVVAAKLELGDAQTLVHADADGNWVLNEIPIYADQLVRCQRHYQLFSSADKIPASLVDYRPNMKSVTATGTIVINNVTYHYASAD